MSDQPDERRGELLLTALALLLLTFSAAYTAQVGFFDPGLAIGFGILIAIGEVARINLPGDREIAPLAAAAALAYALLGDIASGTGATSTEYGPWQVILVTGVAVIVGAVPHAIARRRTRLDELTRRLLVTAFVACAFRPGYLDGTFEVLAPLSLALVLTVIVAMASLLDAVLAAYVRSDRDRSPFSRALLNEIKALVGIGSAVGATGVLIAMAAPVMGVWSIVVFSVPLLLTQFSFRRYATIRRTYQQTIRSLSRVTEVAGYTETGHAQRVRDLSVSVGRELGCSDDDILDLEYAALMHDLGQLSLTDAIPGGATVMAAPGDQRRVAEMGAEVIRQTGVLDHVATIVERQADPYRRPHEQDDASVPLASRIIRAVNAYDDLVGGSLESDRRLEALERLRLGMVYDYDPRVVETLAGVVERQLRATR